MEELIIPLHIRIYTFEELQADDRQLIELAKEAAGRSYAPYSRFAVGAAVRLADGITVTGCNQENAAYPSGMCAERTTLFYANARYPEQAVRTLAVAARNAEGFTSRPVPPCGACRQVLLETEKRYGIPVRLLLYGKQCVYEAESAAGLLPLSFDAQMLSEGDTPKDS